MTDIRQAINDPDRVNWAEVPLADLVATIAVVRDFHTDSDADWDTAETFADAIYNMLAARDALVLCDECDQYYAEARSECPRC